MVKLLVADIDGVLTNGKLYLSNNNIENKTICFKDLDAVSELRQDGIKFAMITGEDNGFVTNFEQKFQPDYLFKGCKDKVSALNNILTTEQIDYQEVSYIGDGKYDINVMQLVGYSLCPSDAIFEVKNIANIILSAKGGAGCLAEAVFNIRKFNKVTFENNANNLYETKEYSVEKIMLKHRAIVDTMLENEKIVESINASISIVINAFTNQKQLLLCGNGGSAADAQHIATEFVSRFYMERRALNAEALTVNTSSLTAISNDYSYERVFSRQVEAKGRSGDVLIGITTSGNSANVMKAFQVARMMGMKTIAFVGENNEKIKNEADVVISVPSKDTPRIQEMHIMIGHIICECVEKEVCI